MANFNVRLPSRDWQVTAFLIFILSQLTTVMTLNCVKVDKCSCNMDDGSGTIDLSKLGNQPGTGSL